MDFFIIGNSKYVDERLNFVVTDLPEKSRCKIRLEIKYSWSDCPCMAYGIYEPDSTGTVNLEESAPIKGSYRGVDSMGLFAACKDKVQIMHKRAKRDYTKEMLVCKFTVSCNEAIIERSITRYFTDTDVICDRILQPFIGYYFHHFDQTENSPILLLGGSEGSANPMLPVAASLANKGFDVLSLQYFSPPGDPDPVKELPIFLRLIPIEYINTAIEWLYQTTKKEISIMGYSKGAELSLLTASLNKKIYKVIAISPSAYIWQSTFSIDSSWSYQKKPIPCLIIIPIFLLIDCTKNLLFKILSLPQGFYISYELSRILIPGKYKEKARIKVEKADSSFLLIAGERDSIWNSAAAVGILEKGLTDSGNNKVQSKVYKDVGHYLYVPFIFGQELTGGGRDKRVLSDANEDSWKEIIRFLKS